MALTTSRQGGGDAAFRFVNVPFGSFMPDRQAAGTTSRRAADEGSGLDLGRNMGLDPGAVTRLGDDELYQPGPSVPSADHSPIG